MSEERMSNEQNQEGGRQDETRPSTIATGVPNLDRVLGGGIPLYAVVIIAGAPGTGKTILAQEILFDVAKRGQKCLYLTTLSESPMKVARYQAGFSFFDPELFGVDVVFVDIGEVIRTQGLTKALGAIVDTLHAVRPAVVVVDSFRAIHDMAPSPAQMRTFIFDLAVEMAAAQTTSFWVGEYAPSDLTALPEMAVADGIIWLTAEMRDNRLIREVRVVKMRGIEYDTAEFTFEITRQGIEIFALDGQVPALPTELLGQVTKTGLPELDNLLGGGVPRGSPILVTGEAGTGKTTLGMQFLYNGATQFGERGVYFSYEETAQQIATNAAKFGWDYDKLIKEGLLQVRYTPLTETNAPKQLLFIERTLRETGAKRAVIDSLTILMRGVGDAERIRRYVFRLAGILKNAGCTAIITSDPIPGSRAISRFGVEESVIDGVIILKSVAEKRGRMRYLEIYKLRGVSHASGDNPMKITKRGIEVFPRIAEAMR